MFVRVMPASGRCNKFGVLADDASELATIGGFAVIIVASLRCHRRETVF